MRRERRTVSYTRQEGFAIIIVLWVLMILSAITMTFVARASIDMKMVKFQRDAAHADEIAKAGFRQAMILIREDALKDLNIDIRKTIVDFEDDDRFVYDGGNEAWAYNPKLYDNVEFGGGTYSVKVRDEAGKLSLNDATEESLFYLLQQIGVDDEDDAHALAGALTDWKDADDAPTVTGKVRGMGDADTEYSYYNPRRRKRRDDERPIYIPKNAPFSSCDELMLVWGITPPIFFGEDSNNNGTLDPNERDENRSWPPDDGDRYLSLGLKNFVTVFTSRTNLNTAPREVFAALLYPQFGDDAEKIAKDLDRYRNGADRTPYTDDDRVMRTIDDSDGDNMHFSKGTSLDPQQLQTFIQGQAIASRFFEVTVVAEYNDVQRGIYGIVRREFIPEDQLPILGEDTDRPEDLEQVVLTTVSYETLDNAQDLYFGQSGKRRHRGSRR